MSKCSKTSNRPKYVSTAVVSRSAKLLITELIVICEMDVERTNKSVVWQYFGRLYHSPANAGNVIQV